MSHRIPPRPKAALAALAVALGLAAAPAPAQAADVSVKTKLGVPVGVTVTLSHAQAQKLGKGEKLDIPGIPSVFEKPFRKLAAKIKEADKGKGVKVTLTVRAVPPGIKSKVEAR